MRKAFTLLEMVVALAILAVIMSFAGFIFRVSVGSQRMAMANAEVMQKLRIITEQLDADFKGGALHYPYIYAGYLSASTVTSTVGGKSVTINSDALGFFTCGDFRSTNQYAGKSVAGNVACVVYFQPDPNSYKRPSQSYENVLLRRQTIMAISAPASSSNPRGEYFVKSPQEWVVNPPFPDPNHWLMRPVVEPNNVKANLPMYVAKGVDNFTIHYLSASTELQTAAIPWDRPSGKSGISSFNPKAFKFTFTLYDSKGILKKGRTFTHIVTWDNS
jgi:prepilin-type N-terminal cleavage/methylation domain-containing protein